MALPEGTTVDRYILEDVLGEGGMAVVYRARHRELGSLHAIKHLKNVDGTIRDRLLQEGRLQSGLRHPNVVTVTDMILIDDSPALVMEFVDGPNLAQLLLQRRLSVYQCDALARGILKGVSAAHAHGMVHRDLKPANILISENDGELVPKIADFGLAKLLHVRADETALTKEGMVMGTPSYMAPEQLSDARSVDGRADVFSLGAILYEMVCGRRCFDGTGVYGIWMAVAKGEFIPPKNIAPTLPERMISAIEGALVVDRKARIQEVSVLMDVWCKAVDGHFVPLQNTTIEVKNDAPTVEANPSDLNTVRDAQRDFALDYTQESHEPHSMPTPSSDSPLGSAEDVPVSIGQNAGSKRAFFVTLLSILVILALSFWQMQDSTSLPETPENESLALNGGPDQGFTVESQPTVTASFAEARRALLAADYPRVATLLQGSLASKTPSVEVQALLALNHYFQNRPSSADTAIDALIRLQEYWAEVPWAALLAQSWHETQDSSTQLDEWRALRAETPDDPLLELAYLVSTRQMTEPRAMGTQIDDSQNRFPQAPIFSVLKSRMFASSGLYAEWHRAIRQAQLRFPASLSVSLEWARSELYLKRFPSAEEVLKRILHRRPDFMMARVMLAKLYVRMGTHEINGPQQLSLVTGDTVPPADQLYFLKAYGSELAAEGYLKEARKIWRFCLVEADKFGRTDEAMECGQAAFEALAWLLPVDQWSEWIQKMERLLSQPTRSAYAREYHASALMWFRALQSLKRGEISESQKVLDRLSSLKAHGAMSPKIGQYEDLLRFESTIQQGRIGAAGAALDDWEASTGGPGRLASCAGMYNRARLSESQGDLRAVEAQLTKLLNDECLRRSGSRYVRKAAQVKLAEAYIGQGKKSNASQVLSQLRSEWDGADAETTPVQRARELEQLIAD